MPIGKDDKSNKLVEQFGTVKKFSFKPKSHTEIGSIKDNIDFTTSVKLSGSRFVTLTNTVALLERALINFMLDLHTLEFNYTEISPPLIVNEEVMFGTGQLPKFEEDQFEIKFDNSDQRKYLIPTAEVVLTNLVRESLINREDLPKRFVASTPCFRKEAGSYGKDTKGMIRQHQFYKVELVSIVEPKNCIIELNRMLNCAKKVLEKLEIPFQVVLLSSGDMGFSAEKLLILKSGCLLKTDIEKFRVVHLVALFKQEEWVQIQISKWQRIVGTLNGSGLAVGRLIIALLENNQNEDGSITIPEALKKYMNNLDKI